MLESLTFGAQISQCRRADRLKTVSPVANSCPSITYSRATCAPRFLYRNSRTSETTQTGMASLRIDVHLEFHSLGFHSADFCSVTCCSTLHWHMGSSGRQTEHLTQRADRECPAERPTWPGRQILALSGKTRRPSHVNAPHSVPA